MAICSLCFPPRQHLFSLLFPSFTFFVLNLALKCFIMSCFFFFLENLRAAKPLDVFSSETANKSGAVVRSPGYLGFTDKDVN